MRTSEEQLQTWASGPSDTELTRCQNAKSMIYDCLKDRFGEGIQVFLQGSYRNSTNVKRESDIDIVVLNPDYYYPDYSHLGVLEQSRAKALAESAGYTFSQFKTEIHGLLAATFGTGGVIRKNKCIHIEENTYRVKADVVPAYMHRRYVSGDRWHEGIELVTDSGTRIHSFPKYHYENGVEKNRATSERYKPTVRILKHIRNRLAEDGLMRMEDMPSFFIESLTWNALDSSFFAGSSHKDRIPAILSGLQLRCGNPLQAMGMKEVNNLKPLFSDAAGRTSAQANRFISLVLENY